MSKKKLQKGNQNWAVIGAGNGGQSLAGHLSLMGFSVRLYDIIPDTIRAIQEQGGIKVDGEVKGFGKITLATTNLGEAIDGAEIIVVVAPATAHKAIAGDCASLLVDGQTVFIHPGATCGALEFRKLLDDENCSAEVTIAEANSLLYACRSPRPGHASIFGIKRELAVAALPSSENKKVVKKLKNAFPQIYAGRNVLETSLGNPNAMMHPGPTLLNTSLIESGKDWLYYWDGITPSIGAFVEGLDKERLAVARAFNLDLLSIRDWYKSAYGVDGETLSELVRQNMAYEGVKGQKTLHTRYLLEDIPMGLVPMVSFGKKLGINVTRMETVVNLAEFLLEKDLTATGRTLENLGLAGMSVGEILQYVETGVKSS